MKEIFKRKLNTNALNCVLFEALYPDVCRQKCFVDVFMFCCSKLEYLTLYIPTCFSAGLHVFWYF